MSKDCKINKQKEMIMYSGLKAATEILAFYALMLTILVAGMSL